MNKMKRALINGIILDGNKNMKPLKGKAIVIEDTNIVDIIEQSTLPADLEVVD